MINERQQENGQKIACKSGWESKFRSITKNVRKIKKIPANINKSFRANTDFKIEFPFPTTTQNKNKEGIAKTVATTKINRKIGKLSNASIKLE